ncbi:MAG TPA: hypothetical protein VNV39_04265 [Stellaceae bacterium]|jgi:hypothetical protein|nr:hypothetical protein [Stellaceae bacterium]
MGNTYVSTPLSRRWPGCISAYFRRRTPVGISELCAVSIEPLIMVFIATPRAQRTCALKRCVWGASLAVASICFVINSPASGQTGAVDAYSVMVQALCRQYATAQQGMPANLMFDQCMIERHCSEISGSQSYHCEPPGPMTWHGGGY